MINNNKEYIVYCHINNINNKKYIGITCQTPEQRFRNGNGYKANKYFYAAIMKYGWGNFNHIILYEHLTEKDAKEKEIELIAKYNTRNKKFGYNLTPGGEGYSGEDNPWYGKHHTFEARKRMSELRKGIPKDDEWRHKISLSNKGKIVSKESREKMKRNHADVSGKNNPCFGRKLSLEHLNKMVSASKSKESIEKMKKHKIWYSGKENPNAKSVMCVETGETYDTLKEASECTGCNATKISAVCHGSRQHTGGLHFKFV